MDATGEEADAAPVRKGKKGKKGKPPKLSLLSIPQTKKNGYCFHNRRDKIFDFEVVQGIFTIFPTSNGEEYFGTKRVPQDMRCLSPRAWERPPVNTGVFPGHVFVNTQLGRPETTLEGLEPVDFRASQVGPDKGR